MKRTLSRLIPLVIVAFVAAAMLATSIASAQTEAPPPAAPPPAAAPAKLKVYTKPIEPFAFKREGKDVGFSLELWDRIARELGVQYEVVWVDSVKAVMDAVQKNDADVGIAAISITSDREKAADFSTPFYESGLAILTKAKGKGVFAIMKETFFTAGMAKAALVLLIILIVCAHLVWFFERNINGEQFPRPYGRGLWESSWWAISTILSGGCDAKGPNHVVGRFFGALWMLTCIIVLTYFTAAITTVMTVSQLTADINGPNDLPGKKVATVAGTTAEKYLKDHGAKVSSFEKIDGAFDSLDKGDVDCVVYDEPILSYHVKTAGTAGQTVVGLFERQNYGIAMPQNSTLRKQINTALLKFSEDGVIDELRAKWFGAN